MTKKKNNYTKQLGSWSFFAGVVLAVLLGLGLTGSYQKPVVWAVFISGIIVGLLNIKNSEVKGFLASSTVLVIVSFFGIAGGIFQVVAPIITNVLVSILTLFVPATIIVALKAVFDYAEK